MRVFLLFGAFLVAGSFAQRARNRRIKTQNIIEEQDDTKRVICYYTNWSVYRKGLAKYQPGNINPYLCTHLVYAFGGMTDEFEVTAFDSYQDIELGGYAKFNGLKQYNKGMKTLLAIGGWNEGSGRFSELVSLPEYRQNFTESVIKHLRRYKFDGLDLDWEYPASREGSLPEDKENYAILVKELREAFEVEGSKVSKGRLLLTMAVPAGKSYIDKGYDIPTLNTYLDFFNILSYDYHSVFEPTVNHHASLLPPFGLSEYELGANLNIDWTIQYYLKKGASKNKLVVGIPTYGRSYTLLDGKFTDIDSSADGPGTKGKYTNEKGYLAFYEICEFISVDGWKVEKPYPKRAGPIAYKGNQWVSYDDEKAVAMKAEYVRDQGLGGIMFWSLDSDDFRGVCNGSPYPLIEAAKKALFTPSATAENEARALLSDSSPGNRINAISNIRNQATTTTRTRRPDRPNRRTTPAVIIDPFNTPEPPTTPPSTKGFNCKREGFQPNPEDCHKYFWCLSSGASGLGIVPHSFTCPSNLMFNKKIGGCDQPQNVKCKIKTITAGAPSTTPFPTTTAFDETLLQDYYYYQDYYYDEDPIVIDAIDVGQSIDILPEEDKIANKNSRGGSQFQNDVDEILPREKETSLIDPKIKPEYTSINRSRTRIAAVEPLAEEPVLRNTNRPQYTQINREEQPELAVVAVQEDKPIIIEEESATNRGSLNYVTLNRESRPTTLAPLIEEPTSDSGRQYVTIQRARPITTTTDSIPVFHAPLDYYDEELLSLVEETLEEVITDPPTTTTTTTIQPPRIRIPSRRPTRPRPPIAFSIRRRNRGRSTTTTTTTEKSPVEETLNTFFNQRPRDATIRRPSHRRLPPRIRLRSQRPSRRERVEEEKKLAREEARLLEIIEQELEAVAATTVAPIEETSTFFESPQQTEVIPVEEPLKVEDKEETTTIEVEPKQIKTETHVDEVIKLFKEQNEILQIEVTTAEATTTRSEMTDEVSTSPPLLEESIVEQKSETIIPVEVEIPTTTVRPRTRIPIRFRSNLRPRPVTPAPEIIADKSEGRDFNPAPSFTDILTEQRLSSSRRTRLPPSLKPKPVVTTEVSVTAATEPSTTTRRKIPVVTSARPALTTQRVPLATIPRRPAQQRTSPAQQSTSPAQQRTSPTQQRTSPAQQRTTTPQTPEFEYVYDYYDDPTNVLEGSLGHLASLSEKAIVLPDGSVECYDTGYFPHPQSCKKFISCSKTVRGFLRGWTYTCPKELVFDPVGAMCNWAEAVDCLWEQQ